MTNSKLQINSKRQNSNEIEKIIQFEKGYIPKEKWICEKCGKSMWDTEHEDLVTLCLHLGCVLKEGKNERSNIKRA